MNKEDKYRNAGGTDLLSQLVGEQGIKADVAVKLAPATIPILVISIVIAIIIGTISANAIMKRIGG
jgi:hypothetical protein